MKAAYIEWVDSFATYGWRNMDDTSTVPVPIKSIGWIVDSTPDSVTLSNAAAATGLVNDPLTIPRAAITFMREISLEKGGNSMATKKITKTPKKAAKKVAIKKSK